MSTPPVIEAFFDEPTNTISYLVADAATGAAAVIDPVLDFDLASGKADVRSAERILAAAEERGLRIVMVLETHAHADHLSAAPYLRQKLGGKIAIGRQICAVQAVFKKIFNAPDMNTDGREFDQLFDDGDSFHLGQWPVRVMHTPGHTPACLTYLLGRHAFVGDTLFMPDYGSARCDFPGGDAATLYRSIQKVLALAPDTQLHLCHDYPPAGRGPMWVSTVAEQRSHNIHVHDGVSEADFVSMRRARDKTLAMPVLILPAVQVNVRAGQLPPPEDNGVSYLKIPVNLL